MLTPEDLAKINALHQEATELQWERGKIIEAQRELTARYDEVDEQLRDIRYKLELMVSPPRNPEPPETYTFFPVKVWPSSCPHCSKENAALGVSVANAAYGTLRWTCMSCGIFETDRHHKVIKVIRHEAEVTPAAKPHKPDHSILDSVFGEGK